MEAFDKGIPVLVGGIVVLEKCFSTVHNKCTSLFSISMSDYSLCKAQWDILQLYKY